MKCFSKKTGTIKVKKSLKVRIAGLILITFVNLLHLSNTKNYE